MPTGHAGLPFVLGRGAPLIAISSSLLSQTIPIYLGVWEPKVQAGDIPLIPGATMAVCRHARSQITRPEARTHRDRRTAGHRRSRAGGMSLQAPCHFGRRTLHRRQSHYLARLKRIEDRPAASIAVVDGRLLHRHPHPDLRTDQRTGRCGAGLLDDHLRHCVVKARPTGCPKPGEAARASRGDHRQWSNPDPDPAGRCEGKRTVD